MATKKEQLTRVTMSQKHDIEAHWKLAKNFIPKAGEIIVYDPDETHDYARFKCGDGVTYVNDLPFIFKIDENYATKEYVNNAVANVTIDVDTTLTKEGEAADAKAVGDKFNNYETKENAQQIIDELTKVKETAEAARTEEEVNAQIDAKVGALELPKTYEPIGAETRAKAYADDLMTNANLNQYTTEKEVKDIVDTVVADAVNGDAVTGLANLVEYFHTYGEEAAQMGAAITELEGDVKNLKDAPSAGIKATDISAWNAKTTAEEVKTQIEAYDYATKTYVNDAVANITIEVDSTLTQAGKAADAKAVGDIASTLCVGADVWIVVDSQVINLSELAAALGKKATSEVVEKLPDTMNPSDPETGIFNVYIIKETGIGYVNFEGQTVTLGYLLSEDQPEAYNKGWSTDIESETEVGIYCVRKFVDIKALTDTVNNLFEAVPGETTHVSNTLTWDGNIDGRTHWEKTTSEGELSMTAQWVHVSDSIPTYEELTAGFEVVESNGLHRVYDPNEEFHWINITDDENCITLTFNEIGIVLLPRIIKIPHIDSNGVVWEKTGIYFIKYNLTTAEGSDGDYIQSFTIPGYDFTVIAPDKKVIKDELIQVDSTLTQAGYAADAKAVGIKLNSCASKEWVTNAISNAETIGVGGGVEVLVRDGDIISSLEQAAELSSGIKVKVETQVVQELPSTLTPSQMTDGGTAYIYVVLGTGVAYADVGYGAMTLGMITFEEAGWDKGWVESIADITEEGFYCIQKAAKGSTDIELIADFNNQSYTFNQGDIEKASANVKDFAHTVLLVKFIVNGVMLDGGFVLYPCSATPSEVIYGCAYNYNTTKNFSTCIFKKSEDSTLWNCEYSNT